VLVPSVCPATRRLLVGAMNMAPTARWEVGQMGALDMSRWQFGITTVYHFLFAPLTTGLAPIIAGMQTSSTAVEPIP
jgi:hypothetical protein